MKMLHSARKLSVAALSLVSALLFLPLRAVEAQIFTPDQQTPTFAEGGLALYLASVQQAFVPSLASVGFVKLDLQDQNAGDGKGSQVVVKLRHGAYNGEVIATSDTLTVGDAFHNVLTFTFPTNILVEPGQTYFLEPIWLGGDGAFIGNGTQYPKGFQVVNGRTNSNNLYFVEGIVQSQLQRPTLTNRAFSVTWAGRGVLQTTPSLAGPWMDVKGLTNSVFTTSTTNSNMQFFRVRR